ncbi:MAG: hypothetical protein ACRDOS_09515 [Gaiellaceae bacterium]
MPLAWIARALGRGASAQPALLREQGFYDADAQIVVVAGPDELAPSVTVDHEVTHLNLVRLSGLGLLEQLLSFGRWLGRGSADPELEPWEADFESPLGAVRVACAGVHEAVAWLGTEIQTDGIEDAEAPDAFRGDVRRLRALVESAAGLVAEGPERLHPYLSAGEAIGIHALGPPALDELFAATAFDVPHLQRTLGGRANDPRARFGRLCDAFAGTDWASFEAWSRSTFKAARTANAEPVDSPARVVPVVHRARLEYRALQLIQRALSSLGAGRPAPSLEELEVRWGAFQLLFTVMPELDVYSQTCVVPAATERGWPVFRGEVTPFQLDLASILVVSRSADHRAGYEWSKPRRDDGVAIVGRMEPLPNVFETFVWETSFDPARRFLASAALGRGASVVVNGVGYDDEQGDFAGFPLLEGIPHVVVRLGDFRSFWFGAAVGGGRGLAGSSVIEWKAMPFPMNPESYFGFIVLKGAGRDWPVVLMPCIVGKYERIVSVAREVPSPHGIQLVEVPGNPYQWLGGMSQAVIDAGRAFESVCT